jgi:hypothetical protein
VQFAVTVHWLKKYCGIWAARAGAAAIMAAKTHCAAAKTVREILRVMSRLLGKCGKGVRT